MSAYRIVGVCGVLVFILFLVLAGVGWAQEALSTQDRGGAPGSSADVDDKSLKDERVDQNNEDNGVQNQATVESTNACVKGTEGCEEGFPPGLLLMVPAFVVLGVRAIYELTWGKLNNAGNPNDSGEQPEGKGNVPKAGGEQSAVSRKGTTLGEKDTNSLFILVALVIWFFTFWMLYRVHGADGTLAFFHPKLSVPLFVPLLGFLGSVIFVADLFRKGRQDINPSQEFAMRLVLGPYVAVIVVLFMDATGFTTTGLSEVEAKAMLAFASGFLVVLALQGLTEKGNELLGRWRQQGRYERSEIATALNLDKDLDAKLAKVNLRFLGQLRSMPAEALKERAKLAGIDSEFLCELQKQAREKERNRLEADLQGKLDEKTWIVLKKHGAGTVRGLSLLTSAGINTIAGQENLSSDSLLKLHEECKAVYVNPCVTAGSP